MKLNTTNQMIREFAKVLESPRVRKNVYYFPTFEAARAYAVANDWPNDRINSFEAGWAIQIHVSGAYVGPNSAGERRHARLMTECRITRDEM